MNELKEKLRRQVLERVDLNGLITDEEILNNIDKILVEQGEKHYIGMKEKKMLKKDIFNSIRGLDLLQDFVEDKSITEIMVNGTDNIFIEKEGRIYPVNQSFESKEKLSDIIQQIVSSSNRIVNESNPIVDARLSDGSRVNVVLPPVAIDGPAVTIRKFPHNPITIEQLIEYKSVSQEAANFLESLILGKYNILVSGGTGSGKTTFLNVLSNFIPKTERIITIEDSAELQINDIPNLVRLEVRNPNTEGENTISIRDLIKTTLRMRPDRIVIGEVRDEAAFDLLMVLNTGHDGSLSTIHANSPKDTLSRLESLVLMAADIPLLAIRKQIASAIDIIVHLGRLRDKSRRVLEISEVLDCEEDEIKLNTIYHFVEKAEEDGKIIGELVKENDLINKKKLLAAGISYDN